MRGGGGAKKKKSLKKGTVPQIIKTRAVLAATSDSAAPNKDLPAPNKEQRQLYFQSTRGIFKAPRLHTLCIMHGRKPSRSEGGEMCNLADGRGGWGGVVRMEGPPCCARL